MARVDEHDSIYSPSIYERFRAYTTEKFLQFDWPRAVVFQLNLKYLHVKITKLLPVVA